MTLTKAEWGQVEERLKGFYTPVAFMCDGYHVLLKLERMSAFKNKICVYVNGKMRFGHKPDTEEVRRFSYPSTMYACSPKFRRDMKKEPKWLQKQMGVNDTMTIYQPFWGSFKALKANLIKHNQEIELLKSWQCKPVISEAPEEATC